MNNLKLETTRKRFLKKFDDINVDLSVSFQTYQKRHDRSSASFLTAINPGAPHFHSCLVHLMQTVGLPTVVYFGPLNHHQVPHLHVGALWATSRACCAWGECMKWHFLAQI